MPAKPCPSRDELTTYARGMLPLPLADEVTEHVSACTNCEDTLHELASLPDALVDRLQVPAAAQPYVDEPACHKVVESVKRRVPGSTEIRPSATAERTQPAATAPARTMNRNEFAEFVTTVGFVSPDELATIEKQLPPAEAADVQTLARVLVEQGKLTKYQAAAVYQGKGKSLVFGEHVVIDRIGAGGMGQVFKAKHRRMDRIVALKVMSTAAMKNADSIKRFEREVRAAAKLAHPNIVHAYDASQQDGVHYLVMEFVDGPDLSSLVKKHGKLPIKQACDFIAQAARGFAFAHGKGVVHRDVKPGNLLVDHDGTVKILDMGLARFEDGVGGVMSEAELTQSGAVMGTIDYMAPEQALNTRHADAKSDVYGLGCTLYRLLTGETVFGGQTMIEKILAHREHPVPVLGRHRPDAPPALAALVGRMLAKNPAERPTMPEVADELTSLATGEPGASATGGSGIGVRGQESGIGKQAVRAIPVAAQAVQSFPVSREVKPSGSAAVRTTAAAPPRRKSKLPLLAAAGAGALLIALGVWLVIRDKDGNEVAKVHVADGATVEVKPNADSIRPAPAAVTPSATATASAPPTTFALPPTPIASAAPAGLPSPLAGEGPGVRGSVAPPDVSTTRSAIRPPAPRPIDSHVPWTPESWAAASTRDEVTITGPFPFVVVPVEQLQTDPSLFEQLAGGDALVLTQKKGNAQAKRGVLEFRVNRDGLYYLAASWVNDGTLDQATRADITQEAGIEKLGWTRVGRTKFVCPVLPVETPAVMGKGEETTVFSRLCQAGETHRIRTRKERAPMIILPAAGGLPPAPVAATAPRPSDAVAFGGHYYKFVYDLHVRRNDAKAKCVQAGGYLASVNSQQEFDFLLKSQNEMKIPDVHKTLWLGGDSTSGQWRWDSGEPFTFFPGGTSPVLNRRPYLKQFPDGRWADEANESNQVGGYICEWNAAPPIVAAPPAVAPFDAAKARAHQEAWAKQLGTTIETTNSVGAKMILIPPGEFSMGSIDGDTAAIAAEKPSHRVQITRPFVIGATEVTLSQFRKFADTTNYVSDAEKRLRTQPELKNQTWREPGYATTEDLPVSMVSWNDAAAFCNWLGNQEKAKYRLPTEAEWEMVCRAGTSTRFWFGDDKTLIARYEWCNENSAGGPQSVGLKLSNPFGLSDLHGNVREWCADGYQSDWYVSSPSVDPLAPPSATSRVLRGGCAASNSGDCRGSYRYSLAPEKCSELYGFRIVRDVVASGAAAATATPITTTPTVATMPGTASIETAVSRPSTPIAIRQPVPDMKAQQAALATVKDVFKDEYAAARTPEQKSALATKFVDQARQTVGDPAARYVLLDESRVLAIEGGNLTALRDAMLLLVREYDVLEATTFLDNWSELLKRPRVDPTAIKVLFDESSGLFDEAVVAARFDDAKRYGDFALSTSRRLPNAAATVKLATERNAALAARQKDWDAIRAASEKLAATPDDAEANLAIGRYRALTAGDWRGALPLLAKSSDEVLKALAEKSLAAAADATAQAALGDAWYDAAQSAKTPQKPELLAGANHWYALAAPALSGLQRARVDKRLTETAAAVPQRKIPATNLPFALAAASPAPTAPDSLNQGVVPTRGFGDPKPATPSGSAVDVLALINPAVHKRNGTWSRDGAAIVSAGGANVSLELPVTPSPGYRLEAIVERHDGIQFLLFGLPVGKRDVNAVLDRRDKPRSGLSQVNGQGPGTNATKYDQPVFTPGKPARIVIDVTPASVRVECDGLKIIDWSGDAATLSISELDQGKHRIQPQTFWIGAFGGPFRLTKLTFQSAAVPPSVATPASPPASIGSAGPGAVAPRAIANVFLANRGLLKILEPGGTEKLVKAAAELPAGDFEILEIHSKYLNTISDADFRTFAGLRKLRQISLSNTEVTGVGCGLLKDLPDFVFLGVDRSPVNDAGLAQIGQLTKLTTLNVSFSEVSDAGLPHLQGLKELNYLNLGVTKVTDVGLARLLPQLPKLDKLTLNEAPVGDATVELLTKLPAMKSVYLRETKITDRCVPSLLKLKHFGMIDLGPTSLSPPAVETLKRELGATVKF